MAKQDKIIKAIEKHRWAYAERELLKRLKAKPNDIELLRLLRNLYWEKKDDQKAFKIAKKAYILAPDDPMVLWGYATCMSNIHKEHDAVKLYKRILKKRNETLVKNIEIKTPIRAQGFKLDACVRIGECYADIGDYENAITYYKNYISEKKEDIPSEYRIREVKKYLKDCLLDYLFNIKKYNQRTYQVAKEAYTLAPNDPMVLWSFAAWTNNVHRYHEAIRLYKKILRKNEKTLARHEDIGTVITAKGFKLDTCVRIGESYMGMNDYARAASYFQRYLKNKRNNVPSEYKIQTVKRYLKECKAAES